MLIILESPGKRTSVAKYTGSKVMASFGHIKDLPEKALGVDLITFDPIFEPINSKQVETIKAIKAAAKGEDVYIATDKDREGDAIAVFIYQEIKSLARNVYRAKFGEITKEAVTKGINEAIDFKNINWGSFNSFLGRRVGDRVVGFLLSPVAHNALNWNKEDYVSVGRVQTIAQKIIVDREREIQNFVPSTSYSIVGLGEKNNSSFKIRLNRENFETKSLADDLLNKVINSRTGTVKDIQEQEVKGKLKVPYVTATLLADASSKLGLNAEQTMFLLQKLYEGFGSGGFITYMRTDSPILSNEYMEKVGEYLQENHPNSYNGQVKHKSKHSQAEAHEAIRPSMHPREALKMHDQIKEHFKDMGSDTAKKAADLFQMITERTIQSQMAVPTYNKTTVLIDVNGVEFTTSGRVLTKKGYLALKDDDEDEKDSNDEETVSLPSLSIGDQINVSDFKIHESTTEAPKRYTEASLIKELEKREIGRPSTYVSTLKTLTSKKFATVENKRLVPTKKSFAVIEFLEKEHPYIVDYQFTAKMEAFLDKVEEEGFDWKDFIKDLYNKMGAENITRRSSGPTPKMIEIAKVIAAKNGIEIPEGTLTDFEKTKKFLDENISSTPSEAQVNLAKNIAKQLGVEVALGILEDKKKLKDWIDKNIKLAQGQKGLSEKQIAIIEKNAPESIKKLIGKNTPEDNAKLKDWIDGYFKKKK